MKIGPDTYQTSANASPARGGPTRAREMALGNANKKCETLGKDIESRTSKLNMHSSEWCSYRYLQMQVGRLNFLGVRPLFIIPSLIDRCGLVAKYQSDDQTPVHRSSR